MMTAELQRDIPSQPHQFTTATSSTTSTTTPTVGSSTARDTQTSSTTSDTTAANPGGSGPKGPEADQPLSKDAEQPLNGRSSSNSSLNQPKNNMASSDATADHPDGKQERPSSDAAPPNHHNPDDPQSDKSSSSPPHPNGTTTQPQGCKSTPPLPPASTAAGISTGTTTATGVSIISQSEDEIDEEEVVLESENDPGESHMRSSARRRSLSPARSTMSMASTVSCEVDVDEHEEELEMFSRIGAAAAAKAASKPHLIEPDQPPETVSTRAASPPHIELSPSGNNPVDVDEFIDRNSPVPPEIHHESESSVDFDSILDEAPAPPPPKIQPKHSYRKPAIKAIREEDPNQLDASQLNFSEHTTNNKPFKETASSSASDLKTKPSLLHFRGNGASGGISTDDDESSIAASVASTPGTQQAVKRASQRVLQVPGESAARPRGSGVSSSATLAKPPSFGEVKRSNSFKDNRKVGRMWRGLKKKVSGVVSMSSSRKPKSKSPQRRSTDAFPSERSPSRQSSAASVASSTASRKSSKVVVVAAPQEQEVPRRGRATRANTASNVTQKRSVSPLGAGIRRVHTSPVRSRAVHRQPSPVRNRVGRFAKSMAAKSSAQDSLAKSGHTPRGRPSDRSVPSRDKTRSRSEEPIPRVDSVFGKRSKKEPPSEEYLKQLEAIGKSLKDGLAYTSMPGRTKGTTQEKCFAGSAAVDFLSNLTRKNRSEALQVGRELVEHFGLFVPVSTGGVSSVIKVHSHDGVTGSLRSTANSLTGGGNYSAFLLHDSSNIHYRIVAYLPMEVKRMNMMTKVRLFEEGVKVKTRRQGLRKHKKCFVGSEAVQFLVRTRMAKTRGEAVELGRKFVRQFNLFEPILRDHEFEDSRNKLYRFVDKRNRYFSIDNMLSTRLISMGREDTDISGEEEDDDYDKDDDGVSSVGGSSFVSRSTNGNDSEDFERFVQQEDGEEDLPKEYQRLTEVAEILERGIKVGDNSKKPGTKKSVSYKDTFVAARAVTFMVTSGLADSRVDAAKLGRRLEREFNLFREVTGKHDFSDSMFYFRFTDKKERFTRPVKAELPLKEVAATFEQGVKVKDHTYRLKTYKNTFMGSRAVDFLVNTRLASSRGHAVRLGCQLVEKYNLFEKVTGNREFEDDQIYFRFTPADRRTVPEEDLPQHKRKRRSGRAFLLNRSEASRASLAVKNVSDEMLAIAESFLNGVKVKEHKFRAKAYRGTFVGSEAVSFMVNSSLAKSRKDAVDLGKKLTHDVGLFLGIDGKREFKDDYLLYRFSQQFEEQLKGSGDSKTPLRGLVSAVSGLNSVSLKSLPLEIIAEAFRNGVRVGGGMMENPDQRRSAAAELLKSSGDIVTQAGEILLRTTTGDSLKGSGRDQSENPKEKEKEKKSKKKKKSKKPDDAFVGSDAVDFLVGSGLAEGRVEAVDLGRSLAREFGLFEHVDQEHEFEDEDLYYQFCYDGEIRPMETINIDVSRLMVIAKDFETCVKVKEHKFRLRTYKKSFLGCEAVDYLVDSCTATSRKEAVQMGRAITKEFNLFEHVTNDRQFEDSNIPYFFVGNSQRYKGLNLEKKRARRNIFASSDDDESDQSGQDDMRDSQNSISMQQQSFNFSFNVDEEEDRDWANKMANFERRMHSTQAAPFISTRHLVANDDNSSVSSSEVRKETMQNRFMDWASKFHRLDPRYQIRYFFDFVAQDGAENAETNVMDVDNLRPLYNFLPSRAQVFTVWRPTSADAIRKMMLGQAVGKGLDIKGKSAKRGKLSGFVPFLQIGENKHKSKIRPPSKEGVVRVFYPGDSRRGRDIAAEKLERVGLEMMETVEEARAVLADNDASKSARKDALDAMLLDLGPDPSITYIDDYAPERYGLEIPERLYWEAYFVRQDCTRKPGSEYDTGRPSQPAFQDMNFAAIRAEPKENAPRAVVYQSADSDSPMNPFELLVAYEEHGRVMPVVSDFDCFLVGTKRVQFQSTLATNQLNVLKWYTGEIESVMKSSKVGDSWTVNWLEILKKAAREGFYPEMPRFGFGDPKSYSIMKNAVSRLSHSGAVRHGAECFNYYFPQDLDDEFLVIANDLPDNKPWAYVDVEGLQDILEEKIEQGFTFPLNPKWVLCDAYRWKELYDKLLLSDKEETKQSMNVWFPPDSGIRELIERVHESRPSGFYKGDDDGDAGDDDDDSSSEGSGAAGAKETMMSTVFAIRLLEKFQERTKKYQSSGESAGDDSDSD